MSRFIKGNGILVMGVTIALIASFFIIGTRINIENNNKNYDIVIDYDEIVKMANQSDHDTKWWLNQFKNEMGINKVGLSEENIISLMENSSVPVSGNLMGIITKEANWKENYPSKLVEEIQLKGFDSYDVLIATGNTYATEFVLDAVKKRIREDKYLVFLEGEKSYILLDGTADVTLYTEKYKEMNSKNVGFMEKIDLEGSKLMYISLGFLPEKIAEINSAGMEIVPRTLSYNGWNDNKFAAAVIDEYNKYGIDPSYIIVGGEAVIGYDDGTILARKYLKEKNTAIGLIENTTQLQNIMQFGVEEIGRANNFNTVRVFSVWNYIQNRYQYYGYPGAEEIENTLFRAVTERNIRVIYFKPVMEFKDLHTYVTNVEVYKDLFDNLDSRLSRHGFTKSEASIMRDFHVESWIKLLIGIGCVLAGLILIDSFLPIKRKYKILLATLGIVGVIGIYAVFPNLLELMVSFSAAVIFGCLAVTLYTNLSKKTADMLNSNTKISKIILRASLVLILSVVLAMVGGIMTAAPISSVNYMLEISIFRGVKVAQLLPIAYFAVAYLAYFGFGSRKGKPGKLEVLDIKDMFNTSIKVWMILLAMMIGAIGAYYIIRTGHDSSLQVLSIEMVFRNKLEDLFIARPRTKEFLFAFPCIMLMVYSAVRKLRLCTVIFGLGGVLGVTSVVNTFMHIRTPLYLGFYRTFYSLTFGLIIGVFCIIIFDMAYKIYNKRLKPKLESEGKKLA